MGLLRSLFWFCIFLASTFGFTVLFEHGFSNFQDNAKKEFQLIKQLYEGKPEKGKEPATKPAP